MVSASDIFAAARAGDVEAVRAFLAAATDLTQLNAHGFTALHEAAAGADQTPVADNLAVLRLLLAAGAPLEQRSRDGRNALYLAAEFAPSTDAVRLLLDAGAEADVYDQHGNHIVSNAFVPEVRQLLSRITAKPVPREEPSAEPVRMRAAQWRAARDRIRVVFDALSADGIVALSEAGTTQEDGFADCTEAYHRRGGAGAGLHGFCFYTEQDAKRAKETSDLTIAFWGAPDGDPRDMERVGTQVVEALRQHGFGVDWDHSGATRPIVDLRDI